ncbi:MAG: hypothetical protein FRX48_05539 [Lasallia pustulata]|uniref:Uncharacterized protein n=1 Tax=Lasallia pustulata TaxID=136370 RepID=A0A5M8PMG6_9LECA|nr:MAG: hypothetical protein FRX48_05539 [Lasallia pustulata]
MLPLPTFQGSLRRQAALQRLSRSFASSSTNHRNIPPESPKFIEVPRTLQPQALVKPRIKGILPVPREIFPPGSRDKTSPEYLAAVTPESTTEKDLSSQDSSTVEYVTWKARQAANRRRNLREGLIELRHRKRVSDRRIAARSAYRRAEHERLIRQPEREDERLTNPTVTQALRPPKTQLLPDPDHEARMAEKRARVAEKEAEKVEERRNMLHSLYMNARTFITSEAQLNSEVDKVFDDLDLWTTAEVRGQNVWNLGPPETVQQMLGRVNRTGKNAVDYNQGYAPITAQRERRIAEELTGGKM